MRDREKLEAELRELDKEERERLLRLMEQMVRARPFGLAVCFDKRTEAFFLADAATNNVVAPPPMNIETVAAWLDDYEQEATE